MDSSVMGINFNALGLALAQGTLIQYAPGIFEGAIAEFLPFIRVSELALYVKQDQNLWEKIPAGYRKTIMELSPKLGPLDWLDAKWLIEKGKKYNTAIYSALQEWPEGQKWLEIQIEDIKKHIGGNNGPKNATNHPRQMPAVRKLRKVG